MLRTGFVSTIAAAGVIAAGMSTGTAWAGGPGGVVENVEGMSVAVGTGTFEGGLVGFVASGNTNEEATANVMAQCQAAGGVECTTDEVTNDDLCIVSVADPNNYVVSGGEGVTVSAALQDAIQDAAARNMPMSASDSVVVISDCSWRD
ncbi:MAG: hypothetical protein ACPGVG_06460 [Mycobacterium sp.]